ncbi:T9SS type A sorting domain-containing protein [Niastella caeni]|uniref:T9SS type A sorting domain-containing protein n=1 Tax=Niastella caeni TaxID=2569763 RepID=A0A4S8HRQ4_9BACT|nr:T9SS type A sorting domain-containing protein [Niastella caeni]THU38197.1 T9SS type A sorting domain-containing protein [Niastella caeni]
MKILFQECKVNCILFTVIWGISIFSVNTIQAQTCPQPVRTFITSNTNTYYPAQQAMVSAGSTSIDIGAATYGTTAISAGDVLLIIQMQGAQINAANDNTYGDGATGRGYLNNAELYAGNMEYIIATNSVPLTGGTLTLQTGTVNNYKNAAFGADGRYTYQVIRVSVYYSLVMNADITPPRWDGTTGGVIVMAVMNNFIMNGYAINVTGAGFRGGGAVRLTGGGGTTSTRDFVTVSPPNDSISSLKGNHASKGEGIAGTPRLINSNHYGSLLLRTDEGYPGGSFGMGAPGNAGGGGSDDGTPINANNSGGGGGGNGGAGGKGGNSYGVNGPYGGYPGAPFAQRSPLRLVMGGGGGAGDTNNGTGNPGGLASSGAAGGGIVIISVGAIIGPGRVLANGNSANSTIVNDASGGGGAGGSVLINARYGHANITVYANGGNGGSNFWNGGNPPHGPGGGGGGGVIYADGTLNAASSATGGAAGTTNSGSGTINYGSLAGAGGISVTGPVMAFPPACMVLPMQFVFVNGKRNGTQVSVNWEVTNEKNVINYTIEKSNNGLEFFTAGTVSKAAGNGDISRYSFSDAPTAAKAAIYYRIVAAEAAGHKTFSKIITVKTALAEGTLDLSPVPAIGHSTITWTSTGNNLLHITLFNVAGNAVLSRQYRLKPGANELLLTNLEALPAGIYIVKATDGVRNANGKLVIHHSF